MLACSSVPPGAELALKPAYVICPGTGQPPTVAQQALRVNNDHYSPDESK